MRCPVRGSALIVLGRHEARQLSGEMTDPEGADPVAMFTVVAADQQLYVPRLRRGTSD